MFLIEVMIYGFLNYFLDIYLSIVDIFTDKYYGYVEDSKLISLPLTNYLPLSFYRYLSELFNLEPYIYYMDGMYYISNGKNTILPPIDCYVVDADNQEKSLKRIINRYHPAIPLWFLIHNENLQDYSYICFNILQLIPGNVTNVKHSIKDNINKKIYELVKT